MIPVSVKRKILEGQGKPSFQAAGRKENPPVAEIKYLWFARGEKALCGKGKEPSFKLSTIERPEAQCKQAWGAGFAV